MTNLDLTGLRVVVTGGGRGLGREICLGFAAAGANLVINDIFVDENGVAAAEQLASDITESGGTAYASDRNIATYAGGTGLIDDAIEQLGGVEVLITMAGNFSPKRFAEAGDEEWDSLSAVHLTGHVSTHRAAARWMIDNQVAGRLITVASRGALFGREVAYAGVKAAVLGLTTSMSVDLAEHCITANSVLPSAETQLFAIPAEMRRFGGMPLSESLDPQRVVSLCHYLASPAADRVTGQFFYVAGDDVCLYELPFVERNRTTFCRSVGGWSAADLATLTDQLAATGGNR
ncbi:SDR family NAD(P)-dependent oxidoreductase [Ammonicoccus fulvus]|uniref:SDR family NAD(P)-dependent oxidoreductase n=1 Tax=Ammonicoccus fulvus TaxID=3138240 RepID=A0ABZ3FJ71_9ACTN